MVVTIILECFIVLASLLAGACVVDGLSSRNDPGARNLFKTCAVIIVVVFGGLLWHVYG